jgi:hypothetical protein
MRLDPRWTTPVVVDQFDDLHVIRPPAAMQSSCGETGDNAATAGPKPTCLCAEFRVKVDLAQRIDVREQSAAPRSQLRLGKNPRGDGFASDERLCHDSSVAGLRCFRHFSCTHVDAHGAGRTLGAESSN